MHKSHETRFDHRIDSIFWFLVQIAPLAIFVAFNLFGTYNIDFGTFISTYRFGFVADIFSSVFYMAFGSSIPFFVFDYLSYCVAVLIAHVLFDVLAFIPRFAHKLIEKVVQ